MLFSSLVFAVVNVLTNFAAIANGKSLGLDQPQVDAVVRVVATCSKERDANPAILVDDAYASIIILTFSDSCRDVEVNAGDLIRVRGTIKHLESSLSLSASSIELVGRTTAPAPVPTSADAILNGECDNKLISFCGRVRDIAHDDVDPDFYFLVLDCNGKYIYAYFNTRNDSTESCKRLINAQVRIRGVCRHTPGAYRKLAGCLVNIREFSEIEVLHKPASAFDAPALDSFSASNPSQASVLGRRRICGRVLSSGRHTPMILLTASGDIVNVRLSSPDDPPRYNDTVEVVGDVATDLYRPWLLNAQWRRSDETGVRSNTNKIQRIKSADILCDNAGRPCVDMPRHGETVSLVGTVISIPTDKHADAIVLLHDEFTDIPVDVSPATAVLNDLSVGCKIDVTGTCAINTELWSPLSNFPRAHGFSIVIRSPSDIVVLSRPSWWTPTRLLLVIISLCLLLSVFLVWIRILNKIIYRRSRQILKEEVARAAADLRVDERTRLAAELHDSVSQNLTAIACHLSAVSKTITTVPEKASSLLQVAEHLLQTCRTDLRYFLYDLRSDLLELPDFTDAVRLTLHRVSGTATISVRFNIDRTRLYDSTAHSILCIVRELAYNAITHGCATHIKVAGSTDAGELYFSVTDNGSGFDPSSAKSYAEGHFGLDGIRNRVKKLDGAFTIQSKIGHGTKAVVTIPLKHP